MSLILHDIIKLLDKIKKLVVIQRWCTSCVQILLCLNHARLTNMIQKYRYKIAHLSRKWIWWDVFLPGYEPLISRQVQFTQLVFLHTWIIVLDWLKHKKRTNPPPSSSILLKKEKHADMAPSQNPLIYKWVSGTRKSWCPFLLNL